MSSVRILPSEIVSKIAAGEVVERPASVLKELLENSLDAGATTIDILVKDAGKSLIKVTDNGSGISREDIERLFHRHATSKISALEDLCQITSLGFRGEALYSIGAISHVRLSSKTKDESHGWEITLHGNERVSLKPSATTNGTEIEVHELFYNTPARKKFMKSNTSELGAMLDVSIPYALLYPSVSMRFVHDEKVLFHAKSTDTHTSRICDILHLNAGDILENERSFRNKSYTIKLILGDINIQRTRKDLQFIFVNGRPVQNKTIRYHVNDIYHLLLAPGVHPFFCVFLSVPLDEVDVNVHPTKREIKLKDESVLASYLRPFTEELLMTASKARQSQQTIFTMPQSDANQTDSPSPQQYPGQQSFPAGANKLPFEETRLLFESPLPQLRSNDSLRKKLEHSCFIGSLLKTYLLFETENSMLVIDQHAAAERINFERLTEQIKRGHVESQPLLSPILIALSPQELLAWGENAKELTAVGFDCTLFDKNTLAVHAHPALITTPETSIRNLLAGGTFNKLTPEALARMACRSSVMAKDTVTKEGAAYLRVNLLACDDPFVCPHGRPTVIEITDRALRKEFLRL
ncbi:MAG TPA: DNA mismatch repair endonuclease MutL [Candidatus Omnitrophota bacterium]|nr:DNA mismatch repair endonuclease MutL [Candidatus Omnitrophota bacterium]HPT06621.1 DNA mismatch repair endonuclease MutL [Candidatus Omnitrophota bacterium]